MSATLLESASLSTPSAARASTASRRAGRILTVVVATQLRLGQPLFTYTLAPVYIAALVWGALYLRDERVRALIRPAR